MKKGNWSQEIDKITERFKISFQDLTEEEFNYKPKPHTWSVGQNIAHIILLNSSYFKHFSEIQSGNHNLFVTENIENLVTDSLNSLLPYTNSDRLMRANTWDIWQPSPGFIGKTMLQEFEEHQHDFKNHVDAFTDVLMENAFIKYPGHAALIFKLSDCIDFLIEHENRHWNQANEIMNFLKVN